jgi:hypothetical protein
MLEVEVSLDFTSIHSVDLDESHYIEEDLTHPPSY